jgi:hypothetical protein
MTARTRRCERRSTPASSCARRTGVHRRAVPMRRHLRHGYRRGDLCSGHRAPTPGPCTQASRPTRPPV